MFIYSMETHLPYALNTASRDLDETKIDTLGPYSYALYFFKLIRKLKIKK